MTDRHLPATNLQDNYCVISKENSVHINIYGSDDIYLKTTSTNSMEVTTLSLTVVFVMCVTVLASNLLVLIVLFCKPHIRRNNRIEFILWLCLSDIIMGMSGLMFFCNFVITNLSTNKHYCSLMFHFIVAGVGQSLAHTFLICLDRYMAVVANIRYKMFNKKYRYIVIFGTWFFVHAYVGTLVVVWVRADSITYCSVDSFPNYKRFLTGANVLYLPFLFVIPYLCISTMVIFKNRTKRTQHLSHITAMTSIRQNYEKQVIVTTGLVVGTLIFLRGPFIITILFLEGSDIIAVNRSTRIFLTVMPLLNSAVNPILYIWRIKKIRLILVKFICPCKTTQTQEH